MVSIAIALSAAETVAVSGTALSQTSAAAGQRLGAALQRAVAAVDATTLQFDNGVIPYASPKEPSAAQPRTTLAGIWKASYEPGSALVTCYGDDGYVGYVGTGANSAPAQYMIWRTPGRSDCTAIKPAACKAKYGSENDTKCDAVTSGDCRQGISVDSSSYAPTTPFRNRHFNCSQRGWYGKTSTARVGIWDHMVGLANPTQMALYTAPAIDRTCADSDVDKCSTSKKTRCSEAADSDVWGGSANYVQGKPLSFYCRQTCSVCGTPQVKAVTLYTVPMSQLNSTIVSMESATTTLYVVDGAAGILLVGAPASDLGKSATGAASASISVTATALAASKFADGSGTAGSYDYVVSNFTWVTSSLHWKLVTVKNSVGAAPCGSPKTSPTTVTPPVDDDSNGVVILLLCKRHCVVPRLPIRSVFVARSGPYACGMTAG